MGLATILAKSSNVGMTKVALSLEPAQMYGTLAALGFGQVTTSGYPGESAGLLPHYSHWRPVGISSMSRGYGLSVTPLQLAHAYATVAAFGVSRPISFLRVETPPAGERALDDGVARMLIHLLANVVAPDGGGKLAAIPGYTVAGKTGTAWKATAGGYATDRYLAVFGGIAPASNPRLAAVVIIDEPGAGKYYGGDVAAPVFSGVVGGALRLLAVPPDAPVRDEQRARAPGGHAMNAMPATPQSLARLLDGIAELPRDVAITRSHAGRPRRATRQRVSRGARQQRARTQIRAAGGRQRRARGVVGAGAGRGDSRPAIGNPGRARAAPARARQPHRGPLLRRALGRAVDRRHHRHQRQDHLRLSTRAGAGDGRAARRPTWAPSAPVVRTA